MKGAWREFRRPQLTNSIFTSQLPHWIWFKNLSKSSLPYTLDHLIKVENLRRNNPYILALYVTAHS